MEGPGGVDPARRVDAGPEDEADMIRRDCTGDFGNPFEGYDSRFSGIAKPLQAKSRDNPILADQGHDVRDRAEGRKVEVRTIELVRLPPDLRRKTRTQLQNDAGPAQVLERILRI